jgi:hypothetical protein
VARRQRIEDSGQRTEGRGRRGQRTGDSGQWTVDTGHGTRNTDTIVDTGQGYGTVDTVQWIRDTPVIKCNGVIVRYHFGGSVKLNARILHLAYMVYL